VKLTKQQLKQIIKEELDTLISEGLFDRLQGLLGRDPEEDEHPLDKYGQGKRKPSRAARPAQPDTAAGWTPQGREGFKWENIQIQGRPSINAYIMKDARSPHYKLILTTESGEEIANKSVSTELKTVTGLVDKLVSSPEPPPLYKDLWGKVYGSVNEVTITKEQLKQIIKEELRTALNEASENNRIEIRSAKYAYSPDHNETDYSVELTVDGDFYEFPDESTDPPRLPGPFPHDVGELMDIIFGRLAAIDEEWNDHNLEETGDSLKNELAQKLKAANWQEGR